MSIRHIVKPPFWYQLLLKIITPLYRWRVWQRARHEPDYQAEVTQRFVVQPQAKNTGVIWIHAVSVGETNAAQPLIQHFLNLHLPVLVTSTTRTGQARVRELFAANNPQQFESVFLPVDSLPLIEKFIATYQPRLLALIETELWPNLLAACAEQAIPTALINARLSARSAKGYGKFSRLTRPMLQQLSLIAAQDNDTAQRFIRLGAVRHAVQVTGSLKFDLHAPAHLLAQATQIRQEWQLATRPLFVVASTHEPEEKLLLEAFHQLLKNYPDALLIIAPRHPQRFDSVAQQISAEGYALYRRSLGQQINPACQVYLADSMGELWAWYALATAAFVGGSLCENGGHNPLEAARLGVPVVMGPHVFNFKHIVEVLATAGALQQAHSAEQVVAIWQNWLAQPTQREQASQGALQVMQANQGALQRQLSALDQLLASAITL
jgi:3-deoxy-D-manno-octulosonic-acid transferase